MRRLFSRLLLLLVLGLLASCSSLIRSPVPAAPSMEAAIEQINGCNAPLQDLQIRGVRPWQQGFVVLYTATCPPQQGVPDPMPQFGHAFVRQTGSQWFHGSGLSLNMREFHPTEFADIGRARGSDEQRQNRFAVLFGRARPEVAAVEVVFDDGSSQRDPITNELFAVVWDGRAKAINLRLLGANGKLLQAKDLPQFKDA
jgi:hypothetical protein